MDVDLNLSTTMNFALREALLVYKGNGDRSGRSNALVVRHEVIPNKVGPAGLGPGEPITYEAATELATTILGDALLEFLPDNVLYRDSRRIVWWTPASVRTMFYGPDTGAEPSELSGKKLPQPALVWFVDGNDLVIRALRKSCRPTPSTPLCLAPYWNVSENGVVCLGSTQIPSVRSVTTLREWEQGFFASAFTHSNTHKKLTSHPKGFFAMWKSHIGKDTFNTRHLVDTKTTMAEMVKSRH